ncbi:RloB family protein [Sulfurimonas sp.]|uniref:RloB family protein n=1 Tax=Sulfurimonas sp. TaxID=2022749 RepID=UPI003D10DA09
MWRDDFHKREKAKRKIKNKSESKSVLIALEDTKSSRYYFEKLVQHKGLSGKVIFAEHIGTNPKKVLEAILSHKSNTIYDKKWIVIDRDSFSNDDFKGTIGEARQKGICVAFSNESYELWILLHFKQVNAYTNREDLKSHLNKIFKEKFRKEYSKASADVYSLVVGEQQTAINNAKRLVTKHIRDYGKINVEQNPITMIYQLVECLNSINLEEKQCDCFPN